MGSLMTLRCDASFLDVTMRGSNFQVSWASLRALIVVFDWPGDRVYVGLFVYPFFHVVLRPPGFHCPRRCIPICDVDDSRIAINRVIAIPWPTWDGMQCCQNDKCDAGLLCVQIGLIMRTLNGYRILHSHETTLQVLFLSPEILKWTAVVACLEKDPPYCRNNLPRWELVCFDSFVAGDFIRGYFCKPIPVSR